MKCPWCGRDRELVMRGRTEWLVHSDTGRPGCKDYTGCKVLSPRHILADGSECQDPIHDGR